MENSRAIIRSDSQNSGLYPILFSVSLTISSPSLYFFYFCIYRDVYSFILKSGQQDIDPALVQNISDDIRRRLDILFAFVRQSVRESVLGFSPDSDIK